MVNVKQEYADLDALSAVRTNYIQFGQYRGSSFAVPGQEVTDLVLLGFEGDLIAELVQAGEDVAEGGDSVLAEREVEDSHRGTAEV